MFLRTIWLLFFFPFLAQAAAPSGETWFTLSTPHFRVHHTAKLENYARKFSASLERALPLIQSSLMWQPQTPIDVVVMDPSDSANGFAANFPNTHIEVFSVPFEPDSLLTQYVDWADELATHELTHIVANDGSRGVFKFLRKIFGSWVKPNGLQPVWLIEGLGVYQETNLSSGGRGRSPILDAILREATLNKRVNNPEYISLDRLNDGVPWWPAGSTAYMIGYSIQAAAAKENKNLPGKISFANSNRMPYMPNTNLENIAGKDWQTIWNETELRLQWRYGSTLSNEPRCQLTKSGKFTGGHRISPDGWVYFSEEDWNHGFHLARFRLSETCDASIERLDERSSQSPAAVAISPDGKKIAYTKSEKSGREKYLNDLFIWDVNEEKSTQITVNARASEPAFLGADLLFVINKGDTTQAIMQRNLATQKETQLFVSKPFERITGLNVGKILGEDTILFSLHNNKGLERIMSLKAGQAMPLLPPENKASFEKNPFVSADGSSLLYASYENGRTQDIYLYDFTAKKKSLIYRSPYGFADRPALSANGKTLLVQEYTSNGMNLVSLPFEKNSEVKNLPALPQEDLHEFLSGEKPAPSEPGPGNFAPSVPYNAASTPAISMWPQYWLPEINFMDYGALIGASTGGNDPLNYHNYSALFQYDTRARFPTYNFTYLNRSFPTYFLFTAQQTNSYFLSTKTSNRHNYFSVEASIPLSEATYTFGTAYQQRRLFGVKSQHFFLYHNLSYQNVGKRPSAIDYNSGTYLNLYAGIFPAARNEKFFMDIRPRASIFFRGLHPSHSMSFSALAGISTNRFLSSNYYLGGGPSYLTPSNFVVRGYPVDTLLGQRISTANFTYTLPLSHPYRGWRTNPLFLANYGLRFMTDVGSANYVAIYRDRIFRGYRAQHIGKRNLVGLGMDLITNGSIFYHIPLSLSLGFHYGLQKDFGGEPTIYFGANLGSLIDSSKKPERTSH